MDRDRILNLIAARSEIFHLEDGYLYWEPVGNGCFSAWELRVIADELDKRNKPWDDHINNDPRIGAPSISDGAIGDFETNS